jgi:hypothetical protein
MTATLSPHEQAPSRPGTVRIPGQRTASDEQEPPDRAQPLRVAARDRVRPVPQRRSRRRWPAAVGGLAAGLAVGTVGAVATIGAMSAPASVIVKPAAAQEPSFTANVSVPGRTLTAFGDGKWQVGVDVAAGTYTSAGTIGPGCYHALRTAMTGGPVVNSTVSPGPATVVLTEADGWFETSGCATWTRTG